MPIIEIAGMPRSGKTTTVVRIAEVYPGIKVYPERLDMVPSELKSPYDFNLWYAKFVVDRQEALIPEPGIHIVERGILDRIAYGIASAQRNRHSANQLKTYLGILKRFADTNTLTILFNDPPSLSLARIRRPKVDPTQETHFLDLLYQAYEELVVNYQRVYKVPESATPAEQYQFTLTTLKSYVNLDTAAL